MFCNKANFIKTAATIAVIQDKFAQKQHFQKVGILFGEFYDIPDEAAIIRVGEQYGYRLMLKSKRLAYDGRGSFVVNTAVEHAAAVAKLGGYAHGLYAEKWQPFSKELAVMLVCARSGQELIVH